MTAAPSLRLEGFSGPIDLLLESVRRQRIDLARLSIVDLAGQFATTLEQAGRAVPLERQGEWLVTASWLVLLKSQLLLPASPAEAAGAQRDAEHERHLLAARALMHEAAAWLATRPELGRHVFPRGARPTERRTRSGSFVALLEATLLVFRGDQGRPEAAVYRTAPPPLWRVADALARLRRLLADTAADTPLAAFLPAVAADAPDRGLRARAVVASTLMAGLELARDGTLTLQQSEAFGTITLRAARRPGEQARGAAPHQAGAGRPQTP